MAMKLLNRDDMPNMVEQSVIDERVGHYWSLLMRDTKLPTVLDVASVMGLVLVRFLGQTCKGNQQAFLYRLVDCLRAQGSDERGHDQ